MGAREADYAMKRSLRSKPQFRHPTLSRAVEVDQIVPFESLKAKLNKCKVKQESSGSVVHWFRTKDLRAEDNTGLYKAYELASKTESSLLSVCIINKEELKSHGVGSNRNAVMVQGIHKLRQQLQKLGIPMKLVLTKSNKETIEALETFMRETKSRHLFANFEYEYDELMRDLAVCKMCINADLSFSLFHDQTVIEPGTVCTNTRTPRKVFTPFWHDWVPLINKTTISLLPCPQQPKAVNAEQIAGPEIDLNKELEVEPNESLEKLWPAGHDQGIDRLNEFVKTKIDFYAKQRSIPSKDCTSRLSPYFAFGFISAREALKACLNKQAKIGLSDNGVDSWVRELAFREFYRQMVASVCPHIVMNLPTSLPLSDAECTDITSEEGQESWKRWTEGRTGYPFIDAGMRQLQSEGYMHNRLRMNVASYLKFNMLLDYRHGMDYFANKLVDWDCCNNCFGWDPSLTVFSPIIQAEKCDPSGQYIRKHVPELRSVLGKAVFDPYHRLTSKEFSKLGYPEPMEEQKDLRQNKERALLVYKNAYHKIKKEQ